MRTSSVMFLAAFLGLLALSVTVQGVSIETAPLHALGTPFYSSYNSRIGTYTIFHLDGGVSFIKRSSLVFTAYIPTNLTGSAYYVTSFSSTSAVVLVTRDATMFQIQCTKASKTCSAVGPVGKLPLPPNRPPVTLIVEGGQGLLMASADMIMTLPVPQGTTGQLSITGSFVWQLKATLTLDKVTNIVESGDENTYVVLSVENSQDISKPGLFVKLMEDYSQSQYFGRPIYTYNPYSPQNLMVARDYENIKYWTAQNTSSISPQAWVCNKGGWVTPYFIPRGFTSTDRFSPSLIGEYAMTQVGVVAFGNSTGFGFKFACLHYAYGMGIPPEIQITKTSTVTAKLGLPYLGVQPNRLSPFLMAVSQTPTGWAYAEIGFGSCPMPMAVKAAAAASRSTSQYADEQVQSSTDFMPFANCRQSSCSIDSAGDCAQQCWGAGAGGGFMCCTHSPL